MLLHLIFEALVELTKAKIHLNVKNFCQITVLKGLLTIVENNLYRELTK